MPTTHSKSERVSRWVGAPEDLSNALSYSGEMLHAWKNEPLDFRGLALVGNATHREDTETGVTDLVRDFAPDATRLGIEVTTSTHSVRIRVQKATPAVSIEVEGEQEWVVEGVLSAVARRLRRGARSPTSGLYLTLALFVGAGVFAGELAVGSWWYDFGDGSIWPFVILVLAVPLFLALVVAAPALLVPNLEVLGTGQRTVWERSRGRVYLTAVLLVGIVGAIASVLSLR